MTTMTGIKADLYDMTATWLKRAKKDYDWAQYAVATRRLWVMTAEETLEDVTVLVGGHWEVVQR